MTDYVTALNAALTRKREKHFPQFLSVSKGLIAATMATLEGSDSGSFDGEPDRHKITTPLLESNIVGSEITTHAKLNLAWAKVSDVMPTAETEKLHKPVLDIDMPLWAKESTTEGHWHLIIDKEIPETHYFELLDVMAKCGILEQGFVDAAKSRGASWIRTPWTRKENDK